MPTTHLLLSISWVAGVSYAQCGIRFLREGNLLHKGPHPRAKLTLGFT